MKKLFIFALLVFFAAACENNVNLVGNDDPVVPDDKEEQDEETQDENADETVDEQVQDEVADETVDSDVVWDNCSENYDCKVGELCAKNIGDCAGWGHCEKLPEGCDDVYDPVCGCDDVTYSNICEANKLYRNAKYSGECE